MIKSAIGKKSREHKTNSTSLTLSTSKFAFVITPAASNDCDKNGVGDDACNENKLLLLCEVGNRFSPATSILAPLALSFVFNGNTSRLPIGALVLFILLSIGKAEAAPEFPPIRLKKSRSDVIPFNCCCSMLLIFNR